jgi:hypothetical protein
LLHPLFVGSFGLACQRTAEAEQAARLRRHTVDPILVRQRSRSERISIEAAVDRRNALLDHLIQQTKDLMVVPPLRNDDGSIDIRPSEMAKSRSFIRIIIGPDAYRLEQET